jgi:O-antigen/teichoic acid export membrane protein
MSGLRKTVVTNIVSNYLTSFVGMALGFLLIPFLILKLGKDAFGLTVLAESAIAFFEVLTISIRIALSRHATFALSQGKREEFEQYLSTGRGLALATTAVVALIALPIGLNFSAIFSVPETFRGQSELLYFLVGAGFCLTIPNTVYWCVLYAHQRFDLINLSTSCGVILRAVLIFVLFSVLPAQHVTLVTYGLVYLAMMALQNTVVYVWHKKLMPDLRIDLSKFRRDRVRDILSFSAHTSLSRLSALLYDNTANILVSIFWGPAATAMYSVASRIPNILKRLFLETAWTLTPTFTDLAARGEKAKVEELLFSYVKLISVITVPMSLGVIFFADPLLLLWVGPGFEDASKLLIVLTVPLLLQLPLSAGGALTQAYGKVSVPSKVGFVFAVVNVFLGAFLGRSMGMGPLGIALSASLCSAVFGALFGAFYVSHVSGIPLGSYISKTLLGPLVMACTVFGAMRLLWQHALGSPGIFSTLSVVLYIVFAALYAFLTIIFLVSPVEKNHLSQMSGEIFKKLGRRR